MMDRQIDKVSCIINNLSDILFLDYLHLTLKKIHMHQRFQEDFTAFRRRRWFKKKKKANATKLKFFLANKAK